MVFDAFSQTLAPGSFVLDEQLLGANAYSLLYKSVLPGTSSGSVFFLISVFCPTKIYLTMSTVSHKEFFSSASEMTYFYVFTYFCITAKYTELYDICGFPFTYTSLLSVPCAGRML